ncbi:MAG: hypothetical protein OEW94_06400 [Betaproteobacteria bacterium]|nr:hypothetical protein [Betaproteobacteria bacterium]MDH5349827.1 hypothetical protein [Betaproteobacteria bacterium]
MSWFWIVGIAANVTLTVLAIVWVIRQGKAPTEPPRDVQTPEDPAEPRA